MKKALDHGSATRVILDMRYIRGGNGGLAQPLIEALAGDKRINRPGGLTVLIGRENVSAGTVVAAALDTQTKAVLIGEMTPARADNFLCDCADTVLQNSLLTLTVPLYRAGTGDPRMAIEPDIPFALTAADFFAGKDPALELALSAKVPGAGRGPPLRSGQRPPEAGEEERQRRDEQPDGDEDDADLDRFGTEDEVGRQPSKTACSWVALSAGW